MSLHYRTAGVPGQPAVLFLHGFMGSSLDWEPVVAELQDHYHCISIDLPGHGLSVVRDTYTFENVLMSVLTLLEELQLPRFSLVGYSMGGRIALYLAQHLRDRVHALVLESANPGIEDEAEREVRRKADHALAERLEADPFPLFLHDWYAQPISSSTLQGRPELLQPLLELRSANDPFELASALRSLSVGCQPDLWPILPELPFPILVISGGLDTKYTEIGRRLTTAGKIAVPETGHNVHLENPDAYIKALSNFLNETSER